MGAALAWPHKSTHRGHGQLGQHFAPCLYSAWRRGDPGYAWGCQMAGQKILEAQPGPCLHRYGSSPSPSRGVPFLGAEQIMCPCIQREKLRPSSAPPPTAPRSGRLSRHSRAETSSDMPKSGQAVAALGILPAARPRLVQ